MRTSILRTALLAATLGCASVTFAATPQQGTQSGSAAAQNRPHRTSMLEQLDLTDSQRSSVQTLMRENVQKARAEIQPLRQKREAVTQATPGSAAYKSAAQALAKAESSATYAQVLRQTKLRADVYNILTPAQRTQLAKLRAERKQKMIQARQAWIKQHQQKAPAASGAASH